MKAYKINPFTVTSPEKLDAERAKQLFVEVFTDFPQVENAGNAMIVGARGAGKSMMFRCLLPDVMMKRCACKFNKLPFVAFHIPIKNSQLKLTDLCRIDNHYASAMINEHFLTLAILIEVCSQVEQYKKLLSASSDEWLRFYRDVFTCNAQIAGFKAIQMVTSRSVDCVEVMKNFFKREYGVFHRYVQSFKPNLDEAIPRFDMPLLSYRSFLHPFLDGLRKLSGFPRNKYIHLYIDDADNLSITQTQVLNSWLGMRLQPSVSIKVSTQVGKYKSFLSVDGTLVESPHDYLKVNISDKYTTSKKIYYRRVRAIVEKRLELSKIKCSAVDYFPFDKDQELAIKRIKCELLSKWKVEGRGNRPRDDASRYARPNYIRDLGGASRSRYTYSYSGFDQLVHLSSGVIRVFLEAASLMYDEAKKAKSADVHRKPIPCSIQNKVIRNMADSYMFSRFEELSIDDKKPYSCSSLTRVTMLRNLLFSMGKTFHNILISDRNERRVFSIALSNEPDGEVKSVLDLGVETGYLQVSTIGRKDGAGRTLLYILNRILSPVFTLDPTGFTGYLFVTNNSIKDAMRSQRLLRELSETTQDIEQLTLFD